jgi:hypothetical protein
VKSSFDWSLASKVNVVILGVSPNAQSPSLNAGKDDAHKLAEPGRLRRTTRSFPHQSPRTFLSMTHVVGWEWELDLDYRSFLFDIIAQ